ncbi:MAG: 16S rRNA (adenine(1518)-N(6)/adenine(1519)-N(6))-dimethyltransferase RsmA [Minisyncoccota bacterium]
MKEIKAKKSLGQNFLVDADIIERIFEVAAVDSADWVIEVGPGTGALTLPLIEKVERLLAIEVDHQLAEHLRKQCTTAHNVSILEGNILDINIPELLEKSGFADHQYKIIANIPYYITAPIIRTLLALKYPPQSLTLMVQEEVADRLSAEPGSMSLLSMMAQYYATVDKKLVVPKTAFDPVPKVNSAVISIVPKRLYDREAEKKVFRLVRAGFSARRKTLVNNLSSYLGVSKEKIEEKLIALNMRLDIRAQALSVEDWERLSAMV